MAVVHASVAHWVVWFGTPAYQGQLALPQTAATIPGVGNLAIVSASTSMDQRAYYAAPLNQVHVDLDGDPYLTVNTLGGDRQLGIFVNVVVGQAEAHASGPAVNTEKDALSHPSTISTARQFALENGIYGNWVQTIRPKVDGDDDSDVVTGPDGTQYKTGVLALDDPRFFMSKDHHWHNRNHPEADLGWALASTDEPKHGVAGVIKDIGAILSSAWKDILKNPLGAALLLLVLVSAAPLLPAAGGVSQVLAVGAVATDAAGLTHGAPGELLKAAEYAASHPAELGDTLAGAELIVASNFAPSDKIKAAMQGLGKKAMQTGLEGFLSGAAPPSIPTVPSSPHSPEQLLKDANAPVGQESKAPASKPWWRFFSPGGRK